MSSMNPLNLRSIDLNLLTVFDAIEHTRNLSRAAERIGMSQPGISQALARLRLTFDDPLFVRAAGAMQPTPRARQIAGPIRAMLDAVTGILTPASGFDFAGSARRFAFAAHDYGACLIVPQLCQKLDEIGAGITLKLPSVAGTRAEEQMRSGKLDLMLSFHPVADPAFHSEPVARDTLSALAREGHPLLRDDMSIDRYCALRHVVIAWPSGKGVRPGEATLFERGLRRVEFVEVASPLTVPAILAATDAVATLPTRLCRHFSDRYGLRVWSLPIFREVAPIYLVWHRSRDEDPGHTWLRVLIADLCRQL